MKISLFVLLMLVGCERFGYDEIGRGKTAKVYLCGPQWTPDQLVMAQGSFDEWLDQDIVLDSGNQPIRFAGHLPDDVYTDASDNDGHYCVYVLEDSCHTSACERLRSGEMWRAAGVFLGDRGDDIIIRGVSVRELDVGLLSPRTGPRSRPKALHRDLASLLRHGEQGWWKVVRRYSIRPPDGL
jgi:hypothetical protein